MTLYRWCTGCFTAVSKARHSLQRRYGPTHTHLYAMVKETHPSIFYGLSLAGQERDRPDANATKDKRQTEAGVSESHCGSPGEQHTQMFLECLCSTGGTDRLEWNPQLMEKVLLSHLSPLIRRNSNWARVGGWQMFWNIWWWCVRLRAFYLYYGDSRWQWAW